jgi:Leucine-rich repeat (LRR) protein
MAGSDKQKKAQAAWDRIEALGGHGVWESDMVFVSFGKSKVTDEDLAFFRDFPFVQVLDLSDTKISDAGLTQLGELPELEQLIVTNSKISENALNEFQRAHPDVIVTTGPPPNGTINRFTGKPL